MKKKHIIELEDNQMAYATTVIDGMPYIKPLQLLPYTEPDLEQVKKEAYEKGFDAGRMLNKGKYEKGLTDAWEAARKIWQSDSYLRIFKVPMRMDCFTKFSASEAIEKIRQYEQEQDEIQVGDEVVSEDDIKAVVIDMDDYLLHVLDENGLIQGWPREDVAKTDRHFPDIATVLKKMKEVQK